MTNNLSFDLCQFARRARAVSQESEISFQDYGSMHTEKRTGFSHRQAAVHIWALNDARFRDVMARHFWSALQYDVRHFPQEFVEHDFKNYCELIDYLALQKLTTRQTHRSALRCANPSLRRKLQPRAQKGWESYRRLIRHNGGYTRVYLLAAWRYLRLGFDSVQCCDGLPLSPTAVRQIINRLTSVARVYYPELVPAERGYGGRKGNTRQKAGERIGPTTDVKKAIRKWKPPAVTVPPHSEEADNENFYEI